MLKKILALLVVLFCVLFIASALDSRINLAVMAGPTGFSSCALDSFINVKVCPSPAEAVAGLLNGSIDMAVLPANKAAAIFNSGKAIKAIAVVGQGMLSIVGTSSNTDILSVPGAGDTPDIMAKYLYPFYKLSYSISAPAQLAQMVIAGKVKLAILPQPFVNMILMKNPKAKIFSYVKDTWTEKTRLDQFPMSILVASEDFAKNNAEKIKAVSASYKKSVSWVLENPEQAGEKIEKLGIMSSAMASNAIKDCALTYKEGDIFKAELSEYYKILFSVMPSSIGNKIPSESFYF